MSQQNFAAKKVIDLSEILFGICVCSCKGQIFFFLLLWNCFCFLANLLRLVILLAVLTRTQEGCGLRKSDEQHKILGGITGSHSLWFLKVCQKSCVIWKWRQDFWTKINSWIFWTAHVQSSNENVLEGSVNSGLWDRLHHSSDNTTEHLKFSKNPRLEKFCSNTEDVNASEGLEK